MILNILKEHKIEIFLLVLGIVGAIIGYQCGKSDGYDIGYKKGYGEAIAVITPKPVQKTDVVSTGVAVQTTTTTTVRPKTQQEIVSNAPAVQIKTEAPKIVASVNGNKYEFKPQSEILQTGVQTTAAINVKIPERKTSIGIGIDNDKKPAYMLKHTFKGATGLWIAGSKHKYMGGISISF